MQNTDLKRLLDAYNPWWGDETRLRWESNLAKFRRPVFDKIVDELDAIPQIISISGPRRVGKSTLLQQIVKHLLDRDVDPARIVYYSLDDPSRFRRPENGAVIIDELMAACQAQSPDETTYLFLDKIQTLERWELYLKKYHDLVYPVRVVISGSASSPIFKKSRESLLGRVKDHHVLPFSFREFLLFELHRAGNDELRREVESLRAEGREAIGAMTHALDQLGTTRVPITPMSDELWHEGSRRLETHFLEGGFPEVWQLPTLESKIEYLNDNQVNKVIYEDLVLAAEFRKPEMLKAFYISLLEQPGREANMTQLARDTNIGVAQVEKYLPLLEMTDLLHRLPKFRASAVRQRRGNIKFYLVDLALRNAVLRIGPDDLRDPKVLGLYAENLAYAAIRQFPGLLQVDYYRERGMEVDFVVHVDGSHYLPIEIKYRDSFVDKDFRGLRHFRDKYATLPSIVVTKNRTDFGLKPDGFFIPLVHFMLAFG